MPEKETVLAVPLARLLTTPDMWRTFAESYLDALDAAGRADPRRPRTVYGSFALVTECLKELPGHQGYLDLAADVGAELPARARELLSERARSLSDAP